MARSKTHIATPPGATIKERLEYHGMSQCEFARRMDCSEKFISQLINGQVVLTSNTAHRLEMVLGAPSTFWMSLEARSRRVHYVRRRQRRVVVWFPATAL